MPVRCPPGRLRVRSVELQGLGLYGENTIGHPTLLEAVRSGKQSNRFFQAQLHSDHQTSGGFA